MADKTATLTAFYTDLSRLCQNEEFEKAIRVANKILASDQYEKKAFQCKIICHIKLGRFDDALNQMNRQPKVSGGLLFEKAYCEYRLNRTSESLKTLNSVPEMDSRMKELYAQVLYRLESYSECFDVYRELVKNTQDDYEEERETNLASVLAALQNWGTEEVEPLGLREDTYELAYNAACYEIGRGDYKKALEKLKVAEELCRESFEDDPDVTPEEVDAELGVIRVQTGYVLQRLGRNDEALKLYNQVIKQRPSDIAIAAVASNNIVTLNKDQNVFDSKKKIKVATADGLQQKLVSEQRKTIAINQCLLYMYTNQGDQCIKTAKRLYEQYPDTEAPRLIEAAQHCKDKHIAKAIDLLQTQISSATDVSLNLKLTLAQLHLTQGSVFDACDTLRSLGDLTYSPGVVSTLVTLYGSQEDHKAAGDFLMEAIDWHKQNNANSKELNLLMRATAQYHLKHGNVQAAAQLLEQLKKRNPGDHKILAQLIAAYSKFDAKKAQQVSKELPSAEELAADLDIEALEQAACTFGPRYIKKVTAKSDGSPAKPQSPRAGASSGTPGTDLVKKKSKKKKKTKLPKQYDASVAPDPERWLPRRERSNFKGRKRDKRKDAGISRGPQGAVSSNVDMYDISKTSGGATSPGNEPTSPRAGAATSQPGPRQQKPASAAAKGKKRKGKGNKW